MTDTDLGTAEGHRTRAALEVVKALALCEHAATHPDLDGSQRLTQLIEAHGILMAACGPGHRIRFGDVLSCVVDDAGDQPLEDLLPDWIKPSGMNHDRLIDSDGVLTSLGFDFSLETPRIYRAARKVGAGPGPLTKAGLDDEYSQEAVFSAIKGSRYEHHRRTLITHPTVSSADKPDLNLPSRAVGFYESVAQYSRYRGKWWWPCPACRWPMKVTTRQRGGHVVGKVRCLYPWHAETGASYEFTARLSSKSAPRLEPMFEARVPDGPHPELWTGANTEVPVAQAVEGHLALVRAVWRYTVVPGLPELALDRALVATLEGTAWSPVLWPDGDRCDHWISGGADQPPRFLADLKDYTWPNQLVLKLQHDGGDRGGAEYLVIPDHRREQIPQLDQECRRHQMRAMTTSDYLDMVANAAKGASA